jgi:hypothetical protein
MTETQNEYFDSESLSRMGTALDEAWRTLPSNQRTPEMKVPSQRQSCISRPKANSISPGFPIGRSA